MRFSTTAVVDERNAMLDTGRAVGNLGEIILAPVLSAPSCRKDNGPVEMTCRSSIFRPFHSSPDLILAQRRCHHILGAVKTFTVIIDGKEKILRTGFGKGRDAAIRAPRALGEASVQLR